MLTLMGFSRRPLEIVVTDPEFEEYPHVICEAYYEPRARIPFVTTFPKVTSIFSPLFKEKTLRQNIELKNDGQGVIPFGIPISKKEFQRLDSVQITIEPSERYNGRSRSHSR